MGGDRHLTVYGSRVPRTPSRLEKLGWDVFWVGMATSKGAEGYIRSNEEKSGDDEDDDDLGFR